MNNQPVKAKLVEVNQDGIPIGMVVPCMFNPYEYSVSKSNSFKEESQNRSKSAALEFSNVGAQTLKLNLLFDTYEQKSDVSLLTNRLWKFMEPKTEQSADKKARPAFVAFVWGVFRFVAVISNMTQTFTLFTHEGIPVRAKVDVTFTQFKDFNDYPLQNPTSGGGPLQEVWMVTDGDRIDAIANSVYGDAGKWRLIADYNGLSNPLALVAGQELLIPLN
jgi:nucleoid-associated protein YgaU